MESLTFLTPEILHINLLWIWNSDELSGVFTSLLGKKLRKGWERLIYLRQVNDRNLSSAGGKFKWTSLGQKGGFGLEKTHFSYLAQKGRKINYVSDGADWKFTQLKDIEVIEERISQEMGKHRWRTDQACSAHQPGRHHGLKDVKGKGENQKDLVVTVCLFKPMDKVRRKETRRGERDHEDLYSLGLCIAMSLKTRQCDSETLSISSQIATWGMWHEFLPGDTCFPPWTANGFDRRNLSFSAPNFCLQITSLWFS